MRDVVDAKGVVTPATRLQFDRRATSMRHPFDATEASRIVVCVAALRPRQAPTTAGRLAGPAKWSAGSV